jgi:ADP-heptose:LPS heptosyltransferase
MGWGDDLMWLGEAEQIHKENPDAVIHDGREYSAMWEGVDWAVSPKYKGDKKVILYPRKPNNGNRWYIKGWGPGKIIYQKYKPKPAPYKIDPLESLEASITLSKRTKRPVVVINPDTKNTTLSDNKNWGLDNWQKLTDLLNRKYDVVRLKPPGQVRDVSGLVKYNQPEIEGTIEFQRENIREAWAIAAQADAIVTPEGGLHHFAAAVDMKAFVIYGGVITPEITGYDGQTNYVYDHPMTPCGSQSSCKHCRDAMNSITPEQIYEDVDWFIVGKYF